MSILRLINVDVRTTKRSKNELLHARHRETEKERKKNNNRQTPIEKYAQRVLQSRFSRLLYVS